MNRLRITAFAALVALALAGCSSGQSEEIPSAGGAATTSNTKQASDEEQAQEFVDCMRDNGIDLPDPEPDGNGGFDFGMADADVDRTSPAFREAIQACRDKLPGGGDLDLDDPELQEQLREFAQCMRDNGVDVPDPEPGGGFGGFADIDPNDPAVRAALEACQDKLPQRGGQ
ncbi:hypothetical protein [Actinophytocola sp.]|uniref:hypothetical protein n=1 Tax=Actinophytocola sp. TaxID=1872138 RepID=UPI002ED30EEF